MSGKIIILILYKMGRLILLNLKKLNVKVVNKDQYIILRMTLVIYVLMKLIIVLLVI